MKKTYLAMCFNLSTSVIDGLGEVEGSAAVWLPMIPSGEVKGRDGRMWSNSEPDAIVEAFDAKLPFDVEHATEILGPKGEAADACGWILALENRKGEIWAQVEWNYLGRYKITDKLYLYYSPAFNYDLQGVITSMSSAGLTNKPNFYVPALNRMEDNTMTLAELIAAALGLPKTATEEEGVVAINALKNDKQVALNRAKNPDLSKFVPKETYTVALNRAETAEAKVAGIEATEQEALVDDAIKQGKVSPANKDMYVGLCRTEEGREQFKAFVGAAAAIVDDKTTKQPKDTATNSKLEDHEVAMCRNMGISQEDFIKSKESMKKEA
ncbi:peptidase [Photobacterium frigidiphilum]|uniref:Peptidase n=1 Tax=Photobacterium frigidiphilum TaxID=264736 RepID=A0A2T3JKI7_9GAMM|nr:phage protease [Photobacterium frigidiphilum]PSU49478.1 peptidase [Photobacterium frigidiphilum]